MTDPSVAAAIPTTVENPDKWTQVARTIESTTGRPPAADLNSVAAFVAESIQLMIDADNAHNPDLLRSHFSPPVVAQLSQFGGGFTGCTAKSLDLFLIGTQPGHGDPVVRFRAQIVVTEPSHDVSNREEFFDIGMNADGTIASPTTCPSCGATLPAGAFICTYCHANTAPGKTPLTVVKLLRIS